MTINFDVSPGTTYGSRWGSIVHLDIQMGHQEPKLKPDLRVFLKMELYLKNVACYMHYEKVQSETDPANPGAIAITTWT
jgi:hypothetical protein